jgi:hypothetical protein
MPPAGPRLRSGVAHSRATTSRARLRTRGLGSFGGGGRQRVADDRRLTRVRGQGVDRVYPDELDRVGRDFAGM